MRKSHTIVALNQTKSMLQRPINTIFLLLLFLMLYSCKQDNGKIIIPSMKKEDPKPVIGSLSGKAYFFGPNFDKKNCTIIAECDCCSSNILFLNERDFIAICYCESEQEFLKGRYQVIGENVVLNYNSLSIDKEYNYEKEVDSTGADIPDYFITTKKSPARKEILKGFSCKGQLYFQTGDTAIDYGAIEKEKTIQDYITLLKEEGIWEMLQ